MKKKEPVELYKFSKRVFYHSQKKIQVRIISLFFHEIKTKSKKMYFLNSGTKLSKPIIFF